LYGYNIKSILYNQSSFNFVAKETGMKREMENAVFEVLENLEKNNVPEPKDRPSFLPSLVPGVSYIQDIASWIRVRILKVD